MTEEFKNAFERLVSVIFEKLYTPAMETALIIATIIVGIIISSWSAPKIYRSIKKYIMKKERF